MNIFAVVMAAGKGTRMSSGELPKVLLPIKGQPMLSYVTKTLLDAGVERPVLVVGYMSDKVREVMGANFDYALQAKQLGTANAVLSAKELLWGKEGITLIVSGDQPFISEVSLERLAKSVEGGATISLLTIDSDDPTFDAFGRVIIDLRGDVQKIVEAKNASEAEREVRLMNLGTYAVDNKWLWEALEMIKSNELTGEYYLTDIIELAVKAGKKVSAIFADSEQEAMGINTPEQLGEAERSLH